MSLVFRGENYFLIQKGPGEDIGIVINVFMYEHRLDGTGPLLLKPIRIITKSVLGKCPKILVKSQY